MVSRRRFLQYSGLTTASLLPLVDGVNAKELFDFIWNMLPDLATNKD